MRKKLFLVAALIMVATHLSFGQEKAGEELATDQFYLKLMSPNIQTRQGLDQYLTSPGGTWNSLYSNNNLYQIYLAKHEKEAFQVYYHEKGAGHDVRLVIDDYTDTNGNILPHTIYKEEFFTVTNVSSDFFAEALVPYNGESIHVDNGQKCVFYVELESAPDQPAGVYTSTFALYEGDELLQSHEITALVWNFALPEAHYGTTFAGLYNSVSGYGGTKGFLEKSGVNFQGGDPASDADRVEAERILEGWQEVLLDHGVSTYEIPRFMIDSDHKKAELALADTRRKAFVVPSYSSEKILQYKDIVYNNPFLDDKSLFYYRDEPHWTGEDDNNYIQAKQFAEYLESLWPGSHSVIPINQGDSFIIQKLREMTDIFCPNQSVIAGNQNMYNTFIDGSWHRTWRYLSQNHLGCIAVVRGTKMHMGTMAKAVYWQQEALNSDGILNWNIGFVPYFNGTPYDVWETHAIYPKNGPANLNGEAIFLYESASLGFDPANPIVSLRLKHMSNGMEDYDYLQLAKEAFGTDEDSPYMQAMNMVFQYYTSAGHQYIFSCETSPWDGSNHSYEWVAHFDDRFVNARIFLGNALSEAMAGQHEYGDWQTAVLPDETHDGLEIRACSHCGTQESRPKTYSSLYRFVGTENNQWANLNNWANNPETLPAPGEAVVIAHDCEINSNTTQFYVVVNDGFNLTINEGATLTSQRITTEGNAQVIVEDGAQLKTMSEGVQATVKKSIAPHNGTGGWHFVSTSLASDVVPNTSNNIVSSTAGNYDLYLFDQSENLEWRNYKVHGFNLENGKGYLYANGEENVSLEFTGTTNRNSQKEFGLAYDANAEFACWNLVGNPYPCNVYADKSYYVLDESGSFIEPNTVSSSIAIAPCTGIMVKAETTDETVTFSKTAPETQGPNNGSLQIAVAQANTRGNSIQDKVIVSFNAGDELEKFFFNEDNAKLYIQQGNRDFAIACSEKSGEMPLNFKAAKDGIYTFSVNPDNVDFHYLHLIDNLTGADVDLLQTPAYSFTAKTTDYTSRFRLVFFANDASSDPASDAPFAFISNGSIVIIGAEADAVLQIVDMQERIIVCCDAAHHVSIDGMTSGVYVLRLIEGESIRTQKIVIE